MIYLYYAGLNDSGPSCSNQGDNHQQRRGPSREDPRRSLNNLLSETYTFTVRWSSMPQETLKKLEASELLKVRADPDDEGELRLALVKKVKSDYKAFKERHPGRQKHPGMTIYKSVTDQVIATFFFINVFYLQFHFRLNM